MSEHNQLEHHLQSLSHAISEAILGCPEVLREVANLLGNRSSEDNARLVLVLKPRALSELLRTGKVDWRYVSWETSIPDPPQYVDGQRLSPEEIRFEEYARRTFDEQTWMRKVGIRFEQ